MDILASLHQHTARKARAWAAFMRRTTALANAADPRTGGNECLCFNWGNEDARRVWRDGWKRWHRYSAKADQISSDLMKAYARGA